jgi:SAM-dependent methyltransferase
MSRRAGNAQVQLRQAAADPDKNAPVPEDAMNAPVRLTLHALQPAPHAGQVDLASLSQRQKAVWFAGNYAAIAATQQIVAETLCAAASIAAAEHVLDVASGTGNAAIAAARRLAHVTAIDFVSEHLAYGRARAMAEGLPAEFRLGQAENLPFGDGMFDVVVSAFGAMFVPDQRKAARELTRVCRAGGRIALACWTPDGLMGRVHALIDRYVAPPPGTESPMQWGREDHLRDLFGARATAIAVRRRTVDVCYRSPEHWLAMAQTHYGPLNRAIDSLDLERRKALQAELVETVRSYNVAGPDTLIAPAAYLEAIVHRR